VPDPTVVNLIAKKRDGGTHTREELDFLAKAAAEGTIPDYQLSAWLMAAYIQGFSPQETADLTLAMAASGERMDLGDLPKPWVDKHSTGGVGDKTTLVLVPLLACCDLTIVKMSGRGLGITGGTIDKLESIPGFRTDLAPEALIRQAKLVGCALTGQTPRLAPADKILYALRDVTGTVDSIPLIVSSILSKKIAGGAETVILDVKCGSGAFMKDLAQAEKLKAALTEVGTLAGLNIRAAITDMDQPLGRAVGNSLEVKEAIRVLRGEETGRFAELCFWFAEETLKALGLNPAKVRESIDNGGAMQMAMHWVREQGGTIEVFDDEEWCRASHVTPLVYKGPSGWVKRVAADKVGELVLDLGGGRRQKTDQIDHSVGVELDVQVGDKIETNQMVGHLHSKNGREIELDWIEVSEEPVEPRPVIVSC
jgi:pyrimidine-nucleoside phosphorylase